MVKLYLTLLFTIITCFCYAQGSGSITVDSELEILTLLIPEDKQPAGFSSERDKEVLVPVKIRECKQLILDNIDNARKVRYYREMIWRLENAVIIEISSIPNIEG